MALDNVGRLRDMSPEKLFLNWEIMRGLPIRVDRQHLQPAVPLLQIRDGGLVSVVCRD